MALSILVPRSLAFVPLLAGVIGYIGLSLREKKLLPLDRGLSLFFGLTVLLSAASYVWADYPDGVVCRSLNTGAIFFAGLLMLAFSGRQSITSRRDIIALLVLYVALGAYFGVEFSWGLPIAHLINPGYQDFFFNRSVVVFTCLLFPLLFLARRYFAHAVVPLALLAAILVTLWLTGSQTAQMVFLCGFAGYGVLWAIRNMHWRRRILNTAGFGINLCILASPLIPGFLLQHIPPDMESSGYATRANIGGRLEIWNFVAGKIMEKPWLGHGIEATRNFQTDLLMPINHAHSILHPHNALLQIWVEFGLAGALLACAFIAFLIVRIQRASHFAQPLYFSALLSSLCLLSTGYGLWQSWQVGFLLTLAAVCVLVTRIPDSEKA